MTWDEVLLAILVALITAPISSYLTYIWTRRTKINEEKIQAAKDMVIILNDTLTRVRHAYYNIENNQIGQLKAISNEFSDYFRSENCKKSLYLPRLILRKELNEVEIDEDIWDLEIMSNIDKALKGEKLEPNEIQKANIELEKTEQRIKAITNLLNKRLF